MFLILYFTLSKKEGYIILINKFVRNYFTKEISVQHQKKHDIGSLKGNLEFNTAGN